MHDAFLSWRGFFVPKRGHSPEEYEDAFAADPVNGRFAVADGASESYCSGDWAKITAEAFVARPGPWATWLPEARARWLKSFEGAELPWYAEAKFEEGGFATLLGIAVAPPATNASGSWRAWAVGDACVFQVRQQVLHRSFPLTRSSEFGNQPELLGSRDPSLRPTRVRRQRLIGRWDQQDVLLLMTDALSQWFLERAEHGEHPWEMLIELADQDAFAQCIDKLRELKELRNDDVTLLIVCPSPAREKC